MAADLLHVWLTLHWANSWNSWCWSVIQGTSKLEMDPPSLFTVYKRTQLQKILWMNWARYACDFDHVKIPSVMLFNHGSSKAHDKHSIHTVSTKWWHLFFFKFRVWCWQLMYLYLYEEKKNTSDSHFTSENTVIQLVKNIQNIEHKSLIVICHNDSNVHTLKCHMQVYNGRSVRSEKRQINKLPAWLLWIGGHFWQMG